MAFNDVTRKMCYIEDDKMAVKRKISYMDWGSHNKEIVVCVHGLTRNSRDFDYLARELSKNYRVICPDIVGRGHSEWLKEPNLYNYETYVSDMKKFFNYLNISHVNWVGTSMGGLIGMMLNACNSGLIKNMVLNDIGPFIPEQSQRRIAKYTSIYPKFNDLDQAERYIRDILSPFGIKNDTDWRYITTHSLTEDDQGYIVLAYDPAISYAFSQGDGIKDMDIWNIWDCVDANFLILRGSLSDILLRDTAERMVKSKNSATLIEFQNVGHAPALMDQEQIDTIYKWLKEKV